MSETQTPTLSQVLYRKLINYVGFAHNLVYKGNRDRNQYRIADNLYVKWNGGIITHIFDTKNSKGLEVVFDMENTHLKRIQLEGMGSKMMYADVRYLMPEAVRQNIHPAILNSYLLLSKPVVEDLQITFTTLFDITSVK